MVPSGLVEDLQDMVYPYLVAAGLAVPRVLGIVLFFPVFTRLGLTGVLRSGIVLALALPLVPEIAQQFAAAGPIGAGQIFALMLKEGFVGAMLGLIFGIPFWAAEAAGDVLDFQRGAASAFLIDPSQVSETTVSGTLFVLVIIALFFIGGGLRILIEGLYDSHLLWPALEFLPRLSDATAMLFLNLLDRVMRIALILAAPLMIAMFLGDLSLALVSRFAPQLHAFDLSFAVKGLIFVFALPVYAIFLMGYLTDALAPLRQALDELATFLR